MIGVTTFVVTTFAGNNLLHLLMLLHMLIMVYYICWRFLYVLVLLHMLVLCVFYRLKTKNLGGFEPYILK